MVCVQENITRRRIALFCIFKEAIPLSHHAPVSDKDRVKLPYSMLRSRIRHYFSLKKSYCYKYEQKVLSFCPFPLLPSIQVFSRNVTVNFVLFALNPHNLLLTERENEDVFLLFENRHWFKIICLGNLRVF